MRYRLSICCIFSSLVAFVSISMTLAAEPPAANSKVMVYRCADANGKISLQDSPCAKSSKQEVREMIRPKDAAVVVKKSPASTKAPEASQTQPVAPFISLVAPPVLYQCTDYEGKTRDSENYDPNPRCEPLWAQGYQMDHVPIEQRSACSWVRDSCVRYEGKALCNRWKIKQKQAESDLRYAFSDTQAYRKSELARINQIVQDSCP